jgi:hypothetical protein
MAPTDRARAFVPSSCAALVLGLAACGTPEEGAPFDRGSDAPVGSDGVPEQARLDYPLPPYGTDVGAVIQNFEFLGWMRPAEAGYDPEALETVSLARFHDASGAAGVKFLVITAGAVWCSACRAEYDDLATGITATYEERGVAFLGTLFEDKAYGPARPSDLALWAKQYDVTFPFVLDPALKLGMFFDVEATPMSMIIDARTMQIVGVETGWVSGGEGSLFSILDGLLAEE